MGRPCTPRYDGIMWVRKMPWVAPMMALMGLECAGDGFWTSPDCARSVYLGLAVAVIMSDPDGPDERVTTSHQYPQAPDETWFLDCVGEHEVAVAARIDELDPGLN